MTIGVRQNKNINPQVLERKKVGNPWSRGVSLSFPGEDYLLSIRGTVSPLMAFLTLKVIVSGTRNVLNVITCNLSSNDGLLLWGASFTIKKSNHMMPGATEPALGLHMLSLFTFCSAQESETRGPPGCKGNRWILIHKIHQLPFKRIFEGIFKT
ncbi:hypothetical protein AVEN_202108-1 [Araneus ventricosus]|uniref:Uncharacterized protein n=1 Tax=Araneus ventricosus TaxID=182803 RepID=A0A4Y2TRE4_ARAVE|nr:hypothetical protein AVEN_202108-1 [Araneus ventricosus]